MLSLQELEAKLKKETTAIKRQMEEIASQAEVSPTKVKLKRLKYYLPAAVAMTLANTFYDGPSLTLPVGPWDLMGAVLIDNNSAANRDVTAKLWDGSVVITSSQVLITAGNNGFLILFGQVTGGKSYTISVAASGVGCLIEVTPLNNNTGCEGTGSYLFATRTDENLI